MAQGIRKRKNKQGIRNKRNNDVKKTAIDDDEDKLLKEAINQAQRDKNSSMTTFVGFAKLVLSVLVLAGLAVLGTSSVSPLRGGAVKNQKTESTASSRRQLDVDPVDTADADAATEAPKPRTPLAVGDHYEVLEKLPHDAGAFTQGLTFDGTRLYESTGLFGRSTVRLVDPQTGKATIKIPMDKRHFGEGMTYYETEEGEGRLIQITWKSRMGFIYNSTDLTEIQRFEYETETGEGWGITYNEKEKEFVVSDGSAWLMFWDRDTLQEKRRVQVMLATVVGDSASSSSSSNLISRPVTRLNELEWYNGTVLANIWYRDVIVQIRPDTGLVQQSYDFSTLYTNRNRHADCFNGISVTDKKDELWVTGKQWPHMYRIRLIAKEDNDE